jgi:hypothetical protein
LGITVIATFTSDAVAGTDEAVAGVKMGHRRLGPQRQGVLATARHEANGSPAAVIACANP